MEPIEKVLIGALAVLLFVALVVGVSQPYFEARTFNKFSDKKATYFDALVSELRVMPSHE